MSFLYVPLLLPADDRLVTLSFNGQPAVSHSDEAIFLALQLEDLLINDLSLRIKLLEKHLQILHSLFPKP